MKENVSSGLNKAVPKFREIMSIGFENNRKKRVDIETEIHSRSFISLLNHKLHRFSLHSFSLC